MRTKPAQLAKAADNFVSAIYDANFHDHGADAGIAALLDALHRRDPALYPDPEEINQVEASAQKLVGCLMLEFGFGVPDTKTHAVRAVEAAIEFWIEQSLLADMVS